jgi:hypothetical protein
LGLFFFFQSVLGFELSACKAGTLPLEPLHQPHFVLAIFQDRVSRTILPRSGFELISLDMHPGIISYFTEKEKCSERLSKTPRVT